MYRTKVLNYLYENYLEPILDFDGLTIDDNDPQCRIKRIDADEQGKSSYLINMTGDKNLSFVKDYESFYTWKMNKDHLEFFNPFIKYKHALFLLLMSSPMLYTRYCKSINDESDLSDLVVSEQLDLTQAELLKYVDIQQITTKSVDDEKIYSYSITLNSDNGDNWKCVSESPIKIVSIIMLMLYIIEFIDGIAPNIYYKCNSKWDEVEKDLINTLAFSIFIQHPLVSTKLWTLLLINSKFVFLIEMLEKLVIYPKNINSKFAYLNVSPSNFSVVPWTLLRIAIYACKFNCI